MKITPRYLLLYLAMVAVAFLLLQQIGTSNTSPDDSYVTNQNNTVIEIQSKGMDIKNVQNHVVVDVFYATDRKIISSESISNRYGDGRDQVKYGIAKVSIPRNHKMGALEGPTLWRLEFRSDPDNHVVVLNFEPLDSSAFFQSIETQTKLSKRKSAFIFVHGYNVTFEDAARRTAQIHYDLGFEGTPVFYSWPSAGEISKYTVDESNVAWSTGNLESFLRDFAENSKADRIYLIGHSMGTRSLTGAYAALIAKQPELRKKFVEIILAAPDIDSDVFKRDIAPAMLAGEGNITLYASSEDHPLQLSKKIHGYPRAGDSGSGLVVIKGMESIDSTGMGTDFLNHSYAVENRSILSDISNIIRNGLRAQDRPGLETIIPAESSVPHWRFRQ